MILISRMSPIVPHSLVSYAAGLIRISFWRFTLASFVGFLPPSAAYTYVGAMVGKALRASAGAAPHDPVTWTFYCLGLVATLAVTVLTTRIARRSFKTYSAEREPVEGPMPALAGPEEPHDPKALPESLAKRYRFLG